MTVEQFADDTMRYLKTVELISRLAFCGNTAEDGKAIWSEEDIKMAIEKTGCMPFSVADVEYIRFLQTDEYNQNATKSLDYLYNALSRCDNEWRFYFFNKNIKPLQDDVNIYREMIRRQFNGLVFYASKEEQDND